MNSEQALRQHYLAVRDRLSRPQLLRIVDKIARVDEGDTIAAVLNETSVEPAPQPFDPDLYLCEGEDRVPWKILVRATCVKHQMSKTELFAQRRFREGVLARNELWYFAKKRTFLSYITIGKMSGGRDHSTVMYGVRKHAERLAAALPIQDDEDEDEDE